jgi:hypothetical protein
VLGCVSAQGGSRSRSDRRLGGRGDAPPTFARIRLAPSCSASSNQAPAAWASRRRVSLRERWYLIEPRRESLLPGRPRERAVPGARRHTPCPAPAGFAGAGAAGQARAKPRHSSFAPEANCRVDIAMNVGIERCSMERRDWRNLRRDGPAVFPFSSMRCHTARFDGSVIRSSTQATARAHAVAAGVAVREMSERQGMCRTIRPRRRE